MKADFHVHTEFSYDSESAPEKMIQGAIQKGLKTICITDHHDLDYMEPGWEVDFDEYFRVLEPLKEKYKNEIEILLGAEFGMQPHLNEQYAKLAQKYPFEFIIASAHMFDGHDPYYPGYFEDKTDEQGYQRAFEITLENVKAFSDYDTLGHLDYIVRYGKNQDRDYSYSKYADYIDEVLKLIIQKGKGLEVNTGGWRFGFDFAHPHQDILRRYKELGGEIITIGSDAHCPKDIAYDFHRIKAYLEACGFAYYTEFRNRTPKFCKI